MFDFHAHPGDDNRDAFLSIIHESEIFSITDTSSIALLPWLEGSIAREKIESLVKADSSLMVGEFGLDKTKEERGSDLDSFYFMAELARSYDRVAVIHSVRYTALILKALKDMGIRRALFHSFMGSYELARDINRAGYLISLTEKALKKKDRARLLTLNFVLETDMNTGLVQKEAIKKLYKDTESILGCSIESRMEMNKRYIWQGNSYA